MTEETRVLGRDLILAAEDVVVETVAVPEWGGHVYVRGMTALDRGRIEDICSRGGGVTIASLREQIAVKTVCDSVGVLILEPSDVAKLGEKSAAALDRIFQVAQRLSGMGEDAVEELAGN